MINFAMNLLIWFLFIICIKESFTIHSGLIFGCSNENWMLASIILTILIIQLKIFNLKSKEGMIFGIALAIIVLICRFIINRFKEDNE